MHATSHAKATHCTLKTWPVFMVLMAGLAFETHGAEPVFAPPKSEWRALFNGRDLAGWDKHISVPDGAGPIVPNRDPKGVFTVTNLNGQMAIHVSGEVYG